jgi:hypothetical protein
MSRPTKVVVTGAGGFSGRHRLCVPRVQALETNVTPLKESDAYPAQPGDLAEALAGLMGDPGRRTRMVLVGRQRALEHHDLDARIPDLVRFHERVAWDS